MKYTSSSLWLALFLGLVTFSAQAQDAQYSQFYASPLYWNPAMAGTAFKQRVVFNFRNQYPVLNGNFLTTSVSYDTYKPNWNGGIGVQVTNDRLANGNMQNNMLMLNYSYRAKLADKMYAHLGIGLGAAIRSINFNRLTFADSFTPGGTGQTAEVPVNGGNVISPELSLGLLVYKKNWFVGISGQHLAFQNVDFVKGGTGAKGETQSPRIIINTGYKYYFDERHWAASKQATNISLTPNVQLRWQGPSAQVDFGATFNYKWLLVGEYLRGFPLNSGSAQYTQDVMSTMVGFTNNENFQVGYSYDVNLNSLSAVGNANHEISLIYTWRLFVPRPKKTYEPLPCPQL